MGTRVPRRGNLLRLCNRLGGARVRVRVATWNVWWRFGPWQRRQDLIAAELADLAADIVCLQEAFVDAGGRDQPAELADHLGLGHHRYTAGAEQAGVAFGNAVLSRWPITRQQVVELPADPDGDEHRRALIVGIAAPSAELVVVTTHLNFRWVHSATRQAQVRTICEALTDWQPFPRPPILTGDLNAGPDCEEMRMLTCKVAPPVRTVGFFDAWEIAGEGAGHTWSRGNSHVGATSVEPDRRIDYVLVGHPMGSNRVIVEEVRRFGMTATDDLHPSDHFGVVAVLDA